MHGINKVQLIGNVGRDPKTKRLESGVPVSTFSFATSESRRTRDGRRVTQTEWHNIVLWRGLAELAEKHIRKGDPLYIEGKLHTRTLRDRDGNVRRVTEIVASNVIMLSPRHKRRNLEEEHKDFTDDVDLENFASSEEQPASEE